MKNFLFLLVPLLSFSQNEHERQAIQSVSESKKVSVIKDYYKSYMDEQNRLISQFKAENRHLDFNLLSLQRVIDGQPIFFQTENATSVASVRANSVYPGGSLGLNVTGAGMTAGIWDGGRVRTTHQDLTGRAIQVDGATAVNQHATHVTGTVIGQGITLSRRGFAYQASAQCNDWTNDITEMFNFATSGYLVSNHSYGNIAANLQTPYFGNYNSQSREIDDIMNVFPYYQVVKSAGNDNGNTALMQYNLKGGYDLINGTSTAKNIITVAATEHVGTYNDPSDVEIASFSNWGPTDDGRIKPDIAAKGVGIFSTNSSSDTAYTQLSGTSMAAPAVTGSIVLLQKHYNNLNPATFMRSATTRALICHTTREAGPMPGPDYQFGWGLLDVYNAAQLISGKGTTTIMEELTLQQSQTYTRTFTITSPQDLKATIVWTDPTGFSNGNGVEDDRTPRLINNLDLKIIKDGTTYYPWKLDPDNPSGAATNTGDNDVDNIERVEIFNAAPGTYTIQVSHKGTLQNGTQDFTLVANSANGLTLNAPDFIADNAFFVYPNPAADMLYFSNPDHLDFSGVSITDISGKLVFNGTAQTTAIDVSGFQSGVYFVKFVTAEKAYIKKFIKK